MVQACRDKLPDCLLIMNEYLSEMRPAQGHWGQSASASSGRNLFVLCPPPSHHDHCYHQPTPTLYVKIPDKPLSQITTSLECPLAALSVGELKKKKKSEIIYKLQTQPKEEKGVTYSP